MNRWTLWGTCRKWLSRLVYLTIAKIRRFEPDRALLICADPRGGSTWLTEAIAQLPGTSILWEPLHLTPVPFFREAGLGWQQHIPREADWPEARHAFQRLFSGKLLNGWLLSQSSITRHLRAQQLIVKFCRANGLLPWLTQNFAFRYAPLHLVRHPCAVVASQLKHGAWDATRTKFVIPRGRYSEAFDPYRAFTEKLTSREEILVAQWCVSNKFLLDVPLSERQWIGLTYEELVQNREAQLAKIEQAWGLYLPETARRQLTQPSVTSMTNRRELADSERTQAWRNAFSAEQLQRMQGVLDAFGITLYRTDDVNPQHPY